MKEEKITTLFLDIGGVLLTNGWGGSARQRAIDYFSLDKVDMEERHHLTFDTYELGKLTLNEYLDRVVFYCERSFTKDEFIAFMFQQSLPIEGAIDFFKKIKHKYKLKVLAVSNEGRELNTYRIEKYKLHELFDGFVSSCYVHFRKPDADLFRMACDISQSAPEHVIYVDDRLMFVQVARSFGIRSLHYEGLDSAIKYMASMGFTLKEN